MFDFLVAHWDLLAAAVAGHVVLSPVSSAVSTSVTWVKTKVSQIETVSASLSAPPKASAPVAKAPSPALPPSTPTA